MGTITDWGELLVVSGLVVEPLVGVLLRRELLLRPALAAGDPVTPTVARNAQREWGWVRQVTGEFARFVCEDAEHAEANRELVDGWLEAWTPDALDAVEALAPLFATLPSADFARAQASVIAEQRVALTGAGLVAEVPA
jgi:hypothetical protein